MVIEWAELRGWLVYHTRDSRGSDKGFPDLVLVRGKRVLFVELKRSMKQRLRAEQQVWFDRLSTAGQVVFLWCPEMWNEIRWILY